MAAYKGAVQCPVTVIDNVLLQWKLVINNVSDSDSRATCRSCSNVITFLACTVGQHVA